MLLNPITLPFHYFQGWLLTMSEKQRPERWDSQLEQIAVRAPSWSSEDNRPQAEAISVASVWQMESPETADAALAGKDGVFVYRRDGHPNERSLGKKLAALHGAATASITAQGMSAVGSVALATLEPGAEVWIANELYGKSTQLFSKDLTRWGAKCTLFDPTSEDDLQRLSKSDARLVMIETISNPRLNVPCLESLADITHAVGGKLAVDNTFATHLLCRPIDYGADIVVESLGKQVNGHSDAMVGLVASKDQAVGDAIAATVSTFGMASSPLDCFLTERGLATIAVRMERACANAMQLAEQLDGLDGIEVDYPGLTTHPQHSKALQQLKGGFGWMVTLHLRPEGDLVMEFFSELGPEIAFVPSLGDVSTTLSHPASTSHRGYSVEERTALGIHDGTVRVSCGIEPAEWLVEKFCSAVRALS
jgi:cystathionine beta-lyase/cystathionine gamma-synthase